MKDFDEYKTKLPYPKKVEYTTVYAYRKGKLLFEGSAETWKKVSDEYDTAVVEKDFNDVAFKDELEAYRRDSARLMTQFKQDLFDEFDVGGHKAEKAYELAWERGHSSGFYAVYDEFEELIDLIS